MPRETVTTQTMKRDIKHDFVFKAILDRQCCSRCDVIRTDYTEEAICLVNDGQIYTDKDIKIIRDWVERFRPYCTTVPEKTQVDEAIDRIERRLTYAGYTARL